MLTGVLFSVIYMLLVRVVGTFGTPAIAALGVGHKIEGRKPSFFEDVKFLLVGPAWLLHFVYRRLGIPY